MAEMERKPIERPAMRDLPPEAIERIERQRADSDLEQAVAEEHF